MSSSSSSAGLPWQARGGGVFDFGQGSALVLASYPVLLLLVLLSAFVKYVWIALALYCAILFVLSCTGRLLAGPVVFVHDEARAAVERGGLSQASIAAIPAFVYAAAAGDGEAQCAVCLEALSGGEEARRLPVCAHTFHVGCIDMWFHSHATCPVCRCHVELPKAGKMAPLPPELPLPPV
ncbi:RING-H2 finger protein ATL39-like [Triticum dicoccoides]|uniref:RING-H2 finger protein ATL39-like n=1 Tax=Triticum dicoccoides TaxID=85692 RepID=UPI001891703E|nr:RING-H2 finger protein ATL39-like [Triticum dicoccoides]